MADRPRFHLAFPVHSLEAAREFYGEWLGCPEGRSNSHWIDFDLHGHQIVAHLAESEGPEDHHNPVDGKSVPVPHFGLILEWADWEVLRDRLTGLGADFIIEPYVRFKDQPGEQATMFLRDPSGNALEFKAFRDEVMVFAKRFNDGSV
ncbi:VOC family protein [Parvularcula sp. LCG005]|uniref:VOC family protein n=1 Tax=Parvularcula sp. LCG005 TaxID=3078805 RepID=UPI002942E89F|nr:VOC family protein [Parvularcula sp. LCG005]WOI53692.1 VOC family protein [Parvularcula sp. LCG005]